MAGLAVAVAVGSYGMAEWRLRRERAEHEKAVARGIGMKLFRLMNETNNDLRHLRPSSMPTDSSPLVLDYSEIHPIVGVFFDTSLSLDPVEIDFLTRAGDPEFLSDVLLAFARQRSIVEALQEYKVRYEALHAMMPIPTKAEGIQVTYELTEGQMLQLTPHMNSLNDFLNSTARNLRENAVRSVDLAKRYTPLMKKHLKLKKWMSFELIT